ncbi:MAG: C10 family peptidase [Bacteroidaceae bacterium]|nr:C10 family peptidase [Bacteroidaceae bacterium]
MGKYLFFILLSCSLIINAQQRTFEKAEMLAVDFISNIQASNHKPSLCSQKVSLAISDDSATLVGNEPFYIFSDSINHAFVIISGDERMNEVLAYSVNTSWRNKELPIALVELLGYYKTQYDALQNGDIYTRSETYGLEIPDVSPLITSIWNQDSPYNDSCPDKTPSGCVATAMSQVMNYHRFPDSGIGYFSYISRTNKFNCSYNFANASFDWSKIKSSYTFGDSKDGCVEVADLTYACGVSVGMDYDYYGSGAYMSDVPYALINFFNYNRNVTYRSRTYYDSAEWYDMLCNELENGRPVIYGGVDPGMGGHAFIIDGCASNTGMFHLNWGWGGSYDGFYLLDALDPGQYKFASTQDMVINISADEVGTHDDVFYADKFSSTQVTFGKSTTFVLSDVYNFSNSSSYVVDYAKFRGRLGIGLYDQEFNYIKSLDEDMLDELNTFYGYKEIVFSTVMTPSLFASPGEYWIAPYVIGEESDFPTRIRTLNGSTDYIKIIVDENDIIGGEGGENFPVTDMFFESFENMKIPDNWSQNIMYGTSKWGVNTVIFASENKPAAADGASYAFLEYSNNTLSLNNNNAATWLITDYMSLATDSLYNIKFAARTLYEGVTSGNMLTLYYENDGKWEMLEQYNIINNNDWQEFSTSISGRGRTRFAFEGNVLKRGTLFLDCISVSLVENPTHVVDIDVEKKIVSVHSITGVELPYRDNLLKTFDNSPNGLYIIRYSDNSSRIVRH